MGEPSPVIEVIASFQIAITPNGRSIIGTRLVIGTPITGCKIT